MNEECVIYDFETLSQDTFNGVVVSVAIMTYTESRFATNPYAFDELVSKAKILKFDVQEQVKKYNRAIDKSTIEWWRQQPKEAQAQIAPSSKDRSITELFNFYAAVVGNNNVKKVYTRGNTFDPVFFESIIKQTGQVMPYDWWCIRDTRSLIEGMSWGSGLSNKFMPDGIENFIHHDPKHDIALDVIRMQTLSNALS